MLNFSFQKTDIGRKYLFVLMIIIYVLQVPLIHIFEYVGRGWKYRYFSSGEKIIYYFLFFFFAVCKNFNMFEVQCVLHCMCVWGLKLRAAVELPSSFLLSALYNFLLFFRFASQVFKLPWCSIGKYLFNR